MGNRATEIQVELKKIFRPRMRLDDVEKAWISLAMEHHKGNVQATSKALGISRATLYRKLREMNGWSGFR